MISASTETRKGFRNQKQHIGRLAPPLYSTDKEMHLMKIWEDEAVR